MQLIMFYNFPTLLLSDIQEAQTIAINMLKNLVVWQYFIDKLSVINYKQQLLNKLCEIEVFIVGEVDKQDMLLHLLRVKLDRPLIYNYVRKNSAVASL